jgi:YD repeat-containing protein
MIMIKNTYLSLLLAVAVSFTSCDTATSQTDNDLAKMDAPQGTTKLVEKTMIYKYETDEIKPRSVSTFTFNEDGNFLTHTQLYPDGKQNSQKYTYDDQGRVSKIEDYSYRINKTAVKTYTYDGENPLTITVAVENGPNYVPKIVQFFEGKKKVKEEIYNNEGVIRESTIIDGDTHTSTSYDNSGNLSRKKVQTFKNGKEIKRINYNQEGDVVSGLEYQLDNNDNMIRSWILDENMDRDKESFGYYYTYDNSAWTLRAGREIRDYGSGPVANIKVRNIKGSTNASISDQDIKAVMKDIKL